jgi:enterochelin esterase-like enzyme
MPQGDKSFFVNAADPGGDFSMIVQFDPDTYRGALEGYGDYADYVIDDVIPYIEQRFAVRAERSARVIAGSAMGGAGAAALAFSYPNVFGAVGIHSPTLFSEERLGPPWIFGLGDAAAFALRDPQTLASSLRSDDGLRIYLDCGYDDERHVPTSNLHYALIEKNIPHTYLTRSNIHDAHYWRTHLAEYLGFYAAGW